MANGSGWHSPTSMFPPGQNGDNDTDRKLTSQTWSLSEHLAQEVNSAWLAVKDAGNEHLKAGRYSEAIDCYGEAEKITRSDRTSFYALMEDFEDLDADSPQRRFQECEDVQDEVDGYLRQDAPGAEHSGFPDFHVMLPNLPAAVCLANRSAALLRAAKEGVLVRVCGAWSCEASELHAMALADAQRATEVCPEYVKAHHRVASAHTALGNVAEAAQEHCALKEYALLHGRLPLGSAALMACGWVDIACHTVVYVQERKKVIYRRIKELQSGGGIDGNVGVTVCHSLVGFMDGQWHMMAVQMPSGLKFECVDFMGMDGENGDDLDLPPHGIASKLSLETAPEVCATRVQELIDAGVDVMGANCGQGLKTHYELVEKAMKKAGLAYVMVLPTMTTGAGNAHRERQMEGLMGDMEALSSPSGMMAAMLASLGMETPP